MLQRLRGLVVLLFLVNPIPAHAQWSLRWPPPTPLPKGDAVVTGRVVDAGTLAAIDGAVVTLVLQESSERAGAVTKTDRAGEYSFPDLPAGRYVMTIESGGYVGYLSAREAQSDGQPPVLTAREAGRVVHDVKLKRGATVSGRVTGHGGMPVADAFVMLIRPVNFRGIPVSVLPPVRTGRNGEYTFSDVPPSVFLVQVGPPMSRSLTRTGTQALYKQTFYPGVAAQDDAASITIAAADTLTGIDIALVPDPHYSIQGRVSFTTTPDQIELQLLSIPPGMVRVTRASIDGSFRFGALPPQRYLMTARASDSHDTLAAFTSIDLTDDVSDVQLFLEQAGTLTGQIVIAGAHSPSIAGVRLAAALSDGATDVDPLLPDQTDIDSSGRFRLDGLFGTRTLKVLGLPDNCSLAGITLNGREAAVARLDFSAGETVDVRVRIQCH